MDKAIFDNTMKTIFNFSRTRGVAFFLASLVFLLGVGCQRYSFPQIPPQKIGTIDKGGLKNKRFFIYAGNRVYNLSNLTSNTQVFTGTVEPAYGTIYYSPIRTESNSKAEAGMLNEVHIVLNAKYDSLAFGILTLPLTDIKEVRMIKKSSIAGEIIAMLVGSWLLGSLGIKAFFAALNSAK